MPALRSGAFALPSKLSTRHIKYSLDHSTHLRTNYFVKCMQVRSLVAQDLRFHGILRCGWSHYPSESRALIRGRQCPTTPQCSSASTKHIRVKPKAPSPFTQLYSFNVIQRRAVTDTKSSRPINSLDCIATWRSACPLVEVL